MWKKRERASDAMVSNLQQKIDKEKWRLHFRLRYADQAEREPAVPAPQPTGRTGRLYEVFLACAGAPDEFPV
jgi:hypothetical protein